MKTRIFRKKNIVQRYPQFTVSLGIVFFTSVIFFKPIYDICTKKVITCDIEQLRELSRARHQ